ncbi:MAG: hypothetical protein R3C45_04510 [Phycisphaerales bacterium]
MLMAYCPPNTNIDAPGAPLSEQHYQALRDAKNGRKKIDLAIGVATFNGWSIGVFAALSALILPLSFSLSGLFVTIGLGVVAYNEFKGRAMLRLLDAKGARHLGYNQIALGGVIVVYCVWSLLAALFGPDAYAEVIAENPELGQVLGSTGELYRFIAAAVYGGAILLTVPYQALMAWYYFSRARHITNYVEQTPAWVTEFQRSAA